MVVITTSHVIMVIPRVQKDVCTADNYNPVLTKTLRLNFSYTRDNPRRSIVISIKAIIKHEAILSLATCKPNSDID